VRDEAEAERRFGALSDGGQVQMPLAKTFLSPRFGMVADRFGVTSWSSSSPGSGSTLSSPAATRGGGRSRFSVPTRYAVLIQTALMLRLSRICPMPVEDSGFLGRAGRFIPARNTPGGWLRSSTGAASYHSIVVPTVLGDHGAGQMRAMLAFRESRRGDMGCRHSFSSQASRRRNRPFFLRSLPTLQGAVLDYTAGTSPSRRTHSVAFDPDQSGLTS
jgi:hypothetical protein